MTKKNTIVINGRPYDALTGLPVKDVSGATQQPQATAPSVSTQTVAKPSISRQPAPHRMKTPQRSRTLRREAVKQPKGAHSSKIIRQTAPKARVEKSPHIQKFAPHPTTSLKTVAAPKTEPQPQPHIHSSTVRAAHHRLASQAAPKPAARSSREIKESLLKESLHKAQPAKHTARHKPVKKPFFAQQLRTSSVISGSLAIVLLGGYLTYINMPGISTRVAATQAGVDATYPGYKPDGYRFKGPVAFNDGQVKVSFASNSGPHHFSINQQKSNWDSQTVLDSFVLGQSEDYITNTSQGITVYTYDKGAAWVNGGVFYTLEGTATLSTEQVLRLANSM